MRVKPWYWPHPAGWQRVHLLNTEDGKHVWGDEAEVFRGMFPTPCFHTTHA